MILTHLPEPAVRPTVTVVIPCYRYGHFLPSVVGSTLAQPHVDVDVIIVDDASPDDSADIARELERSDPRVRTIVHETNRGHIATYNDGLREAEGTYVVLLSADDLLAPGSLGRATRLLEARPDMGLVYGYAPSFSEEVIPTPPRRVTWSVWSGDRWIRRLCRRGNNVVTNPEVVMRTSILREIGGYDPAQPHSADLYMWLRAAALGSVGRVNGRDQAYYRVHGQNMHMTQFAGAATDVRERVETYRTFVENDLNGHPDQADYRELYHRAIAVECLRWAINAWDRDEPDRSTTVIAYSRLAEQLWPPITRTSLWRRCQRRREGSSPGRLDEAWFELDWDIRHRLRWRRWRRFGT